MQPWQVALGLDLVVLAVAVIIIWLSSIRGFITTLLEFIGYIVSLVMAGYFSSALSELIYDKYLQTKIITTLDLTINETLSGLDWTEAVANAVKELPLGIRNIINSVFQSITANAQEFLYSNAQNIASDFVTNTIRPMVISLLTSLFFCIIFTIILFLIKQLVKAIKNFDKIPALGTIDRAMGGIFGALKVTLILMIFFTAVILFVKLTGNQSEFINYEMLNKSLSYTIIEKVNPFI